MTRGPTVAAGQLPELRSRLIKSPPYISAAVICILLAFAFLGAIWGGTWARVSTVLTWAGGFLLAFVWTPAEKMMQANKAKKENNGVLGVYLLWHGLKRRFR